MSDTSDDFTAFLETTRPEVAAAYVNGDAGPLTDISTTADPATFFGPGGGIVEGAGDVLATNQDGAANFAEGSTTTLEVLHAGSSGDLGYWVGRQHAEVQLAGKDQVVPMHLRISELFRREGGEWKLIHRHADPHAEPGGP